MLYTCDARDFCFQIKTDDQVLVLAAAHEADQKVWHEKIYIAIHAKDIVTPVDSMVATKKQRRLSAVGRGRRSMTAEMIDEVPRAAHSEQHAEHCSTPRGTLTLPTAHCPHPRPRPSAARARTS